MSLHYGNRIGNTGSSKNEKYVPSSYSGYFGPWTDSSLIALRYRDSDNIEKACIIMTNDAWSTYTKYEQLANTNSIYGGPRSSKTHWFVKGYWGSGYSIDISTGTMINYGGGQPPYSSFVWDVNTDYVYSQNWSQNIARATHTSAISNSPSWSVQNSATGYIQGINVLGNGAIIACKAHSGTGTYAVRSTDAGATWQTAYTIPGVYSFGGYAISFPGWTGSSTSNGALFWHTNVDIDGEGPNTSKRSDVIYTEDGENWSNLGAQVNGMAAPTYHSRQGSDRLINIPGTNRIWTIKNGNTLFMSTNGYEFSSVNTNPNLGIENIVYDNNKYFYGARKNGTGIDIFKTSDPEHQITSSTLWNQVGNTINILDAASLQGMSLYAPWPN